jgi:hypothetical protein
VDIFAVLEAKGSNGLVLVLKDSRVIGSLRLCCTRLTLSKDGGSVQEVSRSPRYQRIMSIHE